MTLTGALTEFPSMYWETTFKITVADPCPSTKLIQPTPALKDMKTSVLVVQGGIPYFET